MAKTSGKVAGLRAVVVPCSGANRDELLGIEWLRTNELGGYSSSTVTGCNTRRYHGLLVAATNPPVERIVGLSTVMEQLVVGDKIYDLAINEFHDAFSPHGDAHLKEFRDDAAATFVYEIEGVTVTKRVLLDEAANGVTVSYDIDGAAGWLIVRPFTTMRDFHSLRASRGAAPLCKIAADGVTVVAVGPGETPPPLQLWSGDAVYESEPQWWYDQKYRVDLERGQGGYEDIYSPGVFVYDVRAKQKCSVKLFASVGSQRPKLKTTPTAQRRRRNELAASVPTSNREIRRLAAATDAFVVKRDVRDVQVDAAAPDEMGASILAGYPWFADWGRDTFIALPGLLLCTGRFETAERVFRTYCGSISRGMIPNRFDDYGAAPHYNSIDASLWFVVAAQRYVQYSRDAVREKQGVEFARDVLVPACEAILDGYRSGARFDIHADTDGLITGGSRETQLTWMDAKIGDDAFTARYGKAVEVNAMWYCAHAWLGDVFRDADPAKADRYSQQASQIAASFVDVFWNDDGGYLNDCVNDTGVDSSLRPNQIFAVSLPHSPLSPQQQRKVVDAVRGNLLTPLGLRTLAPNDPRYCGAYTGGSESRERAYHQGTVWAWLIGGFVEAYLKVEAADGTNSATAARRTKKWLAGFDAHLNEACLGSISEIFDGDAPHTPRGCCAQAWSVAEVLRAKLIVDAVLQKAKK